MAGSEGTAGVRLPRDNRLLSTAAWLASGAASSAPRGVQALDRGHRALEWMARAFTDERVPATRLYLSPDRRDWRNTATFSFDLAMAARGVAAFSSVARMDGTSAVLRRLSIRVQEICAGSRIMASHISVCDGDPQPPRRWSTQPGPHHLKAGAALLRLPAAVVDEGLRRVCSDTMSHWTGAMQVAWPCPELHALLYGIEGLIIWRGRANDPASGIAEHLYRRLMRLQFPDGTLPAETPAEARSGSYEVRADVLAQALRVGALLRLEGRLPGAGWDHRLELLAQALLRHLRADGGVAFSLDQEIANAWCAMFAHQALVLYSRATSGETWGAEGSDLLI